MTGISELKIVEGYFESKERFVIEKIAGYEAVGAYRAEGLRDMARLIQVDEPLRFYLGEGKTIIVPIEKNEQLRNELFLIADELEKKE